MERIGLWEFDAHAAVLRRGDTQHSLEDRSARVLQVLCRRRGEVVSKEELLVEVWAGRAVSANSVAIVIGDLRRSLGESSSDPVHIMTVGKRGYRLTVDPVAVQLHPTALAWWKLRWMLGGIVTLIATIAVGALIHAAAPIDVVVASTRNETGRVEYDGLARSTSAVVMDSVVRFPSVRVVSGGVPALPGSRRILLVPRLIIWNRAPEVAMTATNEADHAVIWSAFATEHSGNLANDIAHRLSSLQQSLARLPR